MRNTLADSLKGGAILLVVVGHVIQVIHGSTVKCLENELYIAIYSFHMPIFVLVSGYFASKSLECRNFQAFCWRRAQRLLVPFFTWAVILYFQHKLHDGEYLKALMSPLAAYKSIIAPIHGLWFLWALFWVSVIAAAFSISRRNTIVVGLLVCGVSFAIGNDQYFGLRFILWLLPFFVLGYWVKRLRLSIKPWKIPVAIILFGSAWVMLLPYYSNRHFIYTTGMIDRGVGIDFVGLAYRYVLAFLGCGTFWGVMGIVDRYGGVLGRFFVYLGGRSIQIYAIHFFFIPYCLIGANGGVSMFRVFIATCLVVGFSLLVAEIVERASPRTSRILFG
jgi:fucose 4-O-acetylase-like acetyltransferase